MEIDSYDPLKAPDPEAWLALDESTRMQLVEDWHQAARIALPNARAHAMMHAVVENQVAEGDKLPVANRLRQLMAQGLNRHQAIHAIASVLMQHMADLIGGRAGTGDPNARYYSALKRLDARKWLRSE